MIRYYCCYYRDMLNLNNNSSASFTGFDVIVFNEVLYYLEHKKILELYRDILLPTGIVIISSFFKKDVNTIKDVIFQDAVMLYDKVKIV